MIKSKQRVNEKTQLKNALLKEGNLDKSYKIL